MRQSDKREYTWISAGTLVDEMSSSFRDTDAVRAEITRAPGVISRLRNR